MNAAFATVENVETLFRPLSNAEKTRAEALLPLVSDLLRQAAMNRGKNLDEMLATGELLGTVATAVTVDVLSRVLRQETSGEPMTQVQQSAMGYSFQGTYAIPGGGIGQAVMNNDLKRLGISGRQRIGVIDQYDSRRNNPTWRDSGDGC